MNFVFNKTPKILMNYTDIIIDQYDPGWILIPLHNMERDSRHFRFPDLLKRNNEYTYTAVDDYFRGDLFMREMPFHFMIEKVGQEWDIHLGCPTVNRSWYIQDLISAGIMSQYNANIRVVAIDDAFYENIPEERMYRKLWHCLFSGYMRKTNRDRRWLKFFDEEINWEEYEVKHKERKIDYTLTKSTFWNRHIFEKYQQYYRKY